MSHSRTSIDSHFNPSKSRYGYPLPDDCADRHSTTSSLHTHTHTLGSITIINGCCKIASYEAGCFPRPGHTVAGRSVAATIIYERWWKEATCRRNDHIGYHTTTIRISVKQGKATLLDLAFLRKTLPNWTRHAGPRSFPNK